MYFNVYLKSRLNTEQVNILLQLDSLAKHLLEFLRLAARFSRISWEA